MSDQPVRALTRREKYLLASRQISALIAAGLTPRYFLAAGWTPRDFLAAGLTPRDFLAAGLTPRDFRAAGWTPSDFVAAGFDEEDVPLLDRPYSRLLKEIAEGARKFSQQTWGPEDAPTPPDRLCDTAMCTAGSFVSMAGEAGWRLKNRYGWNGAYVLLHDRAHPDAPPQSTGVIPDEWALGYIAEMAEVEARSAEAVYAARDAIKEAEHE